MTNPSLSISAVSGALGAEVRGVELDHLTDDGFAAIKQALLDHQVIFLPDQSPTPDAHAAFARRFGDVEIHPFLPKLDDTHPEIVVLEADAGYIADIFHTDVTWSSSPPIASILHMVKCPSRGGDTIWTNQYLVYESLSPPLRDLLDGLTAVHTAATFGHPEQQAEHPAVRVHPETGRRSLYVNRQFTSHFPQLRRSESDALLQLLCAFAEQPHFQCRYRWTAGTIAIWDNRCTQHYVVNDFDEARRIERVTVLGDLPEGGGPRWEHWTPTGMSGAAAASEVGLI
jgi:taurine dioxygenase